MWTIVCFESDNSVDVVPDFWYNDGSCSWPKKNLNVKKFINRRISPNEIEFDNYSARALSKNIGKYYYIIYYTYYLQYNILQV